VTTGNGALVGLGAGAVGGLVHAIFSIPIALLVRSLIPVNRDFMESILEGLGRDSSGLASILRDYIVQGEELVSLFSAAWFVAIIIKTVITVFLFSLFAMLGGIITAAVLQKRQPQAVYIPPPSRTTEESTSQTAPPDIPEPPPDQL
jgi:hypothetical protein